jgi:hypothetical protein
MKSRQPTQRRSPTEGATAKTLATRRSPSRGIPVAEDARAVRPPKLIQPRTATPKNRSVARDRAAPEESRPADKRCAARRKPTPVATNHQLQGVLIMPTITNRISLQISEADVTEILAAVKVLQDKLVPHLIDLGPEDRRGLPKMGSKTVSFVGKALDYARDHKEFCPPFVELEEFQRDLDAVELLFKLQRPLAQVPTWSRTA